MDCLGAHPGNPTLSAHPNHCLVRLAFQLLLWMSLSDFPPPDCCQSANVAGPMLVHLRTAVHTKLKVAQQRLLKVTAYVKPSFGTMPGCTLRYAYLKLAGASSLPFV